MLEALHHAWTAPKWQQTPVDNIVRDVSGTVGIILLLGVGCVAYILISLWSDDIKAKKKRRQEQADRLAANAEKNRQMAENVSRKGH